MSEPDKQKFRVIARLRNGRLVKGYLQHFQPGSLEDLSSEPNTSLGGPIELHPVDSDEIISLPLDSLKALFFVKSFEGRKDYSEVKFFDKHPPIGGLWVRVQFQDKECLEGVIQNSVHFVADAGFFLKPPDPQSNNEILYVVKASLSDFRILGVKPEY
jgi:hypothetical protein